MTDNTDIEQESGIEVKRTPGGGSPAPPDTWYNLTESDIATMGSRNRNMLREYLVDLRDDVRDGYVSGPDEMPPGITTGDEMLREIRDTLDAIDDAMYQRSRKSRFGADAMLGELGFQPSHRGAGYAQCLECGEHVRRTQLDLHISNCPQRSKAEKDAQLLCPECGGMTYAGDSPGERYCASCEKTVRTENAMRAEGGRDAEMVSEFNTGIDMTRDLPTRRTLERKETEELRRLLDMYYDGHSDAQSDGMMREYLRAIGDIEDILVQRGQMERSTDTVGKRHRQKMNYQDAKSILTDIVDNNFAGMRYSVEPTSDGALLDTGSRSRAISEAIRDMADARVDTGTVVVEPDGGAYPVRFMTQRPVARSDDESVNVETTADKRLGDPSMGPNLPHRQQLEDKSTANLKRLKNYYLRQYEDEPDVEVAQNILTTVRDVEDILVSRGAIERADNIRDNWIDALSKDEDPCEDGWTMLGLKPNGNPRCVPEEDVDDYDPSKAEKDEPEPAEGLEDACWDGYVAVGMKEDPNGEGMVPDCVPVDEAEGE